MHVLDLIFFLNVDIFIFICNIVKTFFFNRGCVYTLSMQASKKCPYIDFKQSDYLFTFSDSVEDWRV